tara:strand:+ start:349 stop:795 length:447 start_codon:yes stop_codon:yes gene_type:complete
MAIYKANSWGRTRSPKNLAGSQAGTVTANSAGDLLGITATTAGYATENQRYLHVLLEDANTGTPTAVKVYGYCHAFQRWFHLDTGFEPNGANGAATQATIDAATDTGGAPAASTPEEREYRVYSILGIDRVAFVGGAHTNIFAACSTF